MELFFTNHLSFDKIFTQQLDSKLAAFLTEYVVRTTFPVKSFLFYVSLVKFSKNIMIVKYNTRVPGLIVIMNYRYESSVKIECCCGKVGNVSKTSDL